MAGTPAYRTGTSLRDGARLIPTGPRGNAVASPLLLTTSILGLDTRRAYGVAGASIPAGAPLPLANGAVRSEAHLPSTSGKGAGMVPALKQVVRRGPRVLPDSPPIMNAVLIA